MPVKLGFIAHTHTARTFKHLHIRILPDHFDNFRHQLYAPDGDIANFIL
ncbi:hypothetical protein Barb7_02102 [Bacteroidales bacterium Barb7]|nr:hypothetical protein Barb7_02102 [Bacteroidales bacterium Barb7]